MQGIIIFIILAIISILVVIPFIVLAYKLNQSVGGIRTHEKITHTSRLNGRVKNPVTGRLKKYNNLHLLWNDNFN